MKPDEIRNELKVKTAELEIAIALHKERDIKILNQQLKELQYQLLTAEIKGKEERQLNDPELDAIIE